MDRRNHHQIVKDRIAMWLHAGNLRWISKATPNNDIVKGTSNLSILEMASRIREFVDMYLTNSDISSTTERIAYASFICKDADRLIRDLLKIAGTPEGDNHGQDRINLLAKIDRLEAENAKLRKQIEGIQQLIARPANTESTITPK